ncbi:hypothetical protein GXW82_38020 [Streptacidiphilus sp. 4-A2]|nr:hypothetical protein [Streptacidiphilus sp. 4-A2]
MLLLPFFFSNLSQKPAEGGAAAGGAAEADGQGSGGNKDNGATTLEMV